MLSVYVILRCDIERNWSGDQVILSDIVLGNVHCCRDIVTVIIRVIHMGRKRTLIMAPNTITQRPI